MARLLVAAQLARIKQKNLAEIAMFLIYVYVAQCSMGARHQQTLKAIAEAESGPSLIISYSHARCTPSGRHRLTHRRMKAVETGYWNLYRFNPSAPAGKVHA